MKTPRFYSLTALALTVTVMPVSADITAQFLPSGPADPAHPNWTQPYRDIPWWFGDVNGPSDAYDISAIMAARLNKNNTGGYEGAVINTPAFNNSPVQAPYGSPGGNFGTSADNITWGNNVTWQFKFNYAWNSGAPTMTMDFTNGVTTKTASAALGSRVIDFVEGNVAKPLTDGGLANPYKEPHELNDLLLRIATIGGNGTKFTMDKVSIDKLFAKVDGGSNEAIKYVDGNGVTQTKLDTIWEWNISPSSRTIDFLFLDNLLPSHTSSLELTGELTFAWTGDVSAISGSGVMFEAKMGDLNLYAAPEISNAAIGLLGLLGIFRRRRDCASRR